MRFPILSAALAALCFALPAAAQLQGHAGTSTRAETRILVATPDFSSFAMASLTHGQPDWKAEYDKPGALDMYKGKVVRLGKDWFTTLITSSDLEIGGARLAPGSYIVGLQVDKDGKLGLAFMDSTKAMKEGVNPFMSWTPEVVAPLTLNKDVAKESVAKMTMTFDAKEADAGKGTFTLAWGKHTATAPVQLHAPAPAPKK